MKREIVFRGKRLDNGEWLHGDLMQCGFHIHICDHTKTTEADFDFMQTEVDPETIGQYTGLKDRNGIDIYEGDILRGALHNHVVKFKDGAFMADVEDKLGYDFIEPKLFKASLVIGNIYDNKTY